MESPDSFTKNLDDLDDLLLEEVIINKPKRLTKNPSKKRQRKTKKQKDILESYWQNYDEWSNDIIEEIATKTGLKSKQVSKWFWDQKVKHKGNTSQKSISHKRTKTCEVEQLDEFPRSSSHNGSSLVKNNISRYQKEEIEVSNFSQTIVENYSNAVQEFKNQENERRIENLSEDKQQYVDNKFINSRPYASDNIKKDSKDEKCENESVMSSKHSVRSTSIRDRLSKMSKNKGLKIKAPSIDDLIQQKPNSFNQETTNNFISNLSVYSKDLKSLPNTTPQSNAVVNSTPGIFHSSVMRNGKQEFAFPLVSFSRGHTPEMKQYTPNKNVFSFDNARSPYRPEYFMKPSGCSPYLAPINFHPDEKVNQGWFFQPMMMNQDSVGKTPDGNVFFGMNHQNSSSKKFNKNVFFNFDQKSVIDQSKSAFNAPQQMHERKE